METRTVDLKQGIEYNGKTHTTLTIRQQIVKDYFELDKITGENKRQVKAAFLRVLKLGDGDNPGDMVLEQMTADDLDRLFFACQEWDAEAREDITEKQKQLIEKAEKAGE